MVRRGFRGAVTCATLVALLAACPPAFGAFPGDNGKLAFAGTVGTGQPDVYVVNTDGTGLVNLTNHAADDLGAAWSPDGKRIAFQTTRDGNGEIYVMNANGSGPTRLTTNPAADGGAAWSPDGTKIAFNSNRDGDFEIWVMNADGTGQAQLTSNSAFDVSPSWSPDGTSIVFARDSIELRTMASDGTGEAPFTPCGQLFCSILLPDWSPDGLNRILYLIDAVPDGDREQSLEWKPVAGGTGDTVATAFEGENCCLDGDSWSPDGKRVVYSQAGGLKLADPDGSNVTNVPTGTLYPADPDWQPVIHKEFPRPKGATPLRVSLVPAFRQCGSPNRTHGPPLASRSCNPTVPLSPNVSMGAPDWDGAQVAFSGSARFSASLGNPTTAADEADVQITTDMVDVRCTAAANALCGSANGSGAADYTGSLVGAVQLRITDEDNAPFPDPPAFTGPGTVQDTSIAWVIPCIQSSETTRGSTCSTATTADALVPGIVREKQRANWELGQMLVFDGGPDGDPSTAANTEIFLTQGVFVP